MIISNGLPSGFGASNGLPLQALGETTPLSATSYWYSTDGMPLIDRWATYAAIYESQPNISGIIDKKAAYLARLTPLGVVDLSDPEHPTADTSSDYAKLMQEPCSFLDTFAFWTWWHSIYQIYGEVFAVKVREGGIGVGGPGDPIQSLAPMHPTRTWIKRIGRGPDGLGELIAGKLYPPGEEVYTFTLGVASDGLIIVPRSEVISMRRFNANTLMRGSSRLESLSRTIQNEDAIRRAVSSTWQRGAMPTIVVTQEGNPQRGAAERLRAKIEEAHSGPSKAGGTLVLPAGMTAEAFQIDPQKMQLIESLKFTREEAISRMDLPPTAIHIMDHATFTNITEQLRSVYRDVMIPEFEAVESVLDFDLRPEYFPTPDHRAKFDLNEVLRGDFESRVDKAVAIMVNNIGTRNEARELVGLPSSDEPGSDKFYGNQALVVMTGEPPAPPPALTPPAIHVMPSADGSEGDATPKAPAPPKEQVTRAIMGRVGRALKANDRAALRQRLEQEHMDAMSSILDKQRAHVKSMGTKAQGSINLDQFDGPADDALNPVITATAQAGGSIVAKKVNKKYDVGSMKNYIAATSASTAANMNSANAQELQQRRDDWELSQGPWDDQVDEFYDTSAQSRAELLITSLVTTFLAKAGFEAATHHGMTEKTWDYIPGAKGSRADHAGMAGETVPLQDAFSNGLQIAGDPSGSADDNAGCCCVNDFN